MAAWVPIADLPEVGDTWSVCAHGGKVYLTLGWTPTYGNGYPWILEYDPAADTYTQKAECPDPATYGCSAYWDGVLYLIGGYGDGSPTRVLGYNIATDTWFTCAALPYEAGDANAVGIAGGAAGKIVVVGGYGDTGLHGHVQVYDIATDTWAVGTDFPGVIAYQAMVPGSAAGTIQTIGGYGNIGGTNDDPKNDMTVVYQYTVATGVWSHVGDIAYPIDSPAFAQVGANAYLVAGAYVPDFDYSPIVQVWGISSHTPQHDTDYPLGLWAPAAAVIGTTIYVFAGWSSTVGESAAAYKLATDPQPGWPSAPTLDETPGDSAYRPILIPTSGGSSDQSGTLTATTVDATQKGYDPWPGYAPPWSSVWIKFPRMPEGGFVGATVHGDNFTQGWYAAIMRVPPGSSFFGNRDGGNQLAGATAILDNFDSFMATDGTYDYYLIVISHPDDEQSFTVDWRHAIPLSEPHNDGKYTLAVPERRNLLPWFNKPTWTRGIGTSSYPTYPGNPNPYTTYFLAPSGPNDGTLITEEHIGAGIRSVHFTEAGVTVGAPTLLHTDAEDGGGTIYHTDFLGDDGIAAMLTTRIEGEPEFWVYGFDAATQAFGFAPGPVGHYNANNIWTVRLSATLGLFFVDADNTGIGPYISSGIIGIVDFAGVTPTITPISLDEALGSPTPSTQSATVFTFTWATRLSDTTALVVFRYQEDVGNEEIGYGHWEVRHKVAVLTVSGSTATFGPLTDVDNGTIDIGRVAPENFETPTGFFEFCKFRSPTAGKVEVTVRTLPSDDIQHAVFTISGGAVTLAYEAMPTGNFIIYQYPKYTAPGLGWALLSLENIAGAPANLVAPVSRFTQSGVRYRLEQSDDQDVSLDLEHAVYIGVPYGDYNEEYGAKFFGGDRFRLLGDLLVAVSGSSGWVSVLKVPPQLADPRPAQHASIIEVDPTVPDTTGYAIAAYTVVHQFVGEADSSPALLMGDAHRADHGSWQAIDSNSYLPTLFHIGYRAVDYLNEPPWIPDQDLDMRVERSSGSPTVIGVRLDTANYFASAGDAVSFVAHCMALVVWAFDGTDPPVIEARASIEFYNAVHDVIATAHGPWLILPFFDAGFRPVKMKAAAPAGTTNVGFTVEARHADGAAFTGLDAQVVVSFPDFWIGIDKIVDFADNGLVTLGDDLVAAGPTDPGGPTQLHKIGGAAFGPRADHHALVVGVDDGTVWAAAWLGAPTYEYRIRQYDHLGGLLRDYPSPRGMPVQLAPTADWLYYIVGDMNVYGIHLATGTDVVVIDSAYNRDHLGNFYIGGLAVLKQPTGAAPDPDGTDMPLLPDGIVLLTGGQDDAYVTQIGVTTYPSGGLHFAASSMTPGTLHAESTRSFVYLARGSLNGYDHGIARMWTDGIRWYEDPVVTFLTPERAAAVALVPSRVVHILSVRGVSNAVHRGRQLKTAYVSAGPMKPNRRVATGGDYVRIAWEVLGTVFEDGPGAQPVNIDGKLVKGILTADIAGASDTYVTITRDGDDIGTLFLPATETEWETTFPTLIDWASGQEVDFTPAPGDGLEGLTVELDWTWS